MFTKNTVISQKRVTVFFYFITALNPHFFSQYIVLPIHSRKTFFSTKCKNELTTKSQPTIQWQFFILGFLLGPMEYLSNLWWQVYSCSLSSNKNLFIRNREFKTSCSGDLAAARFSRS